jgi:transcription elongation factor Elf1
MVTPKGTLGIKFKDNTGKVLIEAKVDDDIEKRFSRRTGKAIQIVYNQKKIVHLHCKACDNEWKIKEGSDWKQKFDVNGPTITCKKCGKIYEAG